MKREKDIVKWADEIADFAKMVEDFTGKTLTVENLDAAIKTINAKRRALARVYEARKATNCIPISGKDALLVTQIAFFDDPARCAEMANKLAEELEQRVADGVSVFPAGTKRILLTGTPLAIPNWKLHHVIETSGAAVVYEEMCTGTRYFENEVDESQTTLGGQFMALSERYMKNNCACFTPNPGRIEDIIRLAKVYQVDGVIDVNLKFCTLYDIEKSSVAQALEAEGIPCLGTVFAESEVISLVGKGDPRENIANGVIASVVKRVATLVGQVSVDRYLLTGGLCENDYVREQLSQILKAPITSTPEARYAGALGAALTARELTVKKRQRDNRLGVKQFDDFLNFQYSSSR